MTSSARRQRIEAMLAEEPGDAFLRYSLAFELEKEGDHAGSLDLHRALCDDSPPHVPSFLMAGQQLAAASRYSDARDFLRRGIEAARDAGNAHAAGEMAELLASLGDKGE